MKRYSIILAAALVLALLAASAGCGGSPAASTTAAGAGAATTAATAAADATEAAAVGAAEPADTAAGAADGAGAPEGAEGAGGANGAEAGANPWAGFDTSKELNMIFYAVGTKGTDHDRVVKLASDRMKELINTTVEVPIIPLSDFQTKYPLVLAGGEDVDIIMTHPYIGPFTTHADNGAFYELTDSFLSQWMPETMKSQIPVSWNQAMYKGKLYQIPRNQSDYEQAYGVVVRKDLREKYGVPEITGFAQFEQYLFAVAGGEKESGIFAMYANPTVPMTLTFLNGINSWQTVGSALWDSKKGALDPDDLFMMVETPEYREYCLRMAEWARRGVWPSNAITGVTHITDLFSESKSASDICMYKAANTDIIDMEKKGIEAEYFSIMPPEAHTRISPYNYDALAITSFSRNPERAALAIDVMKNDYEVNNLMQGGVEGEHYILEADNTHSNGPNADAYPWSGWAWCLRSLMNPGEGGIAPSVMEIRGQYDRANLDPANFPVDGFTVDNSAFVAETALLNSLNQEWATSFDLGVFGGDTEAKLDEYVGLLKEAGLDMVLEETKVQLKDFLANQ
ncbi:MAG: ABC transporter substrate-binding protein [Clostridiales bacterium]|jgi:ABC-type glycerol-3-phosphate transport system substrate-binding protein|nr:ABC transporter substrate-binding protein [Clostridiales bacterium]